jgi:hypothetical protein
MRLSFRRANKAIILPGTQTILKNYCAHVVHKLIKNKYYMPFIFRVVQRQFVKIYASVGYSEKKHPTSIAATDLAGL